MVLRARTGGDGAAGTEPMLPDERDVLLWREDGEARASVDHVPRHSPTGIEWGYAGRGPADLARSILLRFAPPEEADRHYHAFKREVIAKVPPRGGRIPAAFVISWLNEHR